MTPAGDGESAPPLPRRAKWPWLLGSSLASGPFTAVATQFASPQWVEAYYAKGIGLAIAYGIGRVTDLVPFSVAETGGIALLAGILTTFARARRRIAGWPAWLGSCAIRILAIVSVGYAIFTGVWGLNYRREPIAGVFDLPVVKSTPDEVRLLALDFFVAMEAARVRAPSIDGVAALGSPSTAAASQSAAPTPESERRAWALVRTATFFAEAGQQYPFLSGQFANPKPIIGSIFASYAGLGGIYIPFTAEPHVNNDVPDFVLPFNACHEVAHQRGVAREDEANYVGFRVARDYGDPDFVYSAYFGIDGHVVNALQKVDPDLALRLWSGRSGALKADSTAYRKWHETRQSRLRGVSDAVNSAYLKSNGIKDGVQSYGRVVDLLLAEQRAQEKEAAPRARVDRMQTRIAAHLAKLAGDGER